MAAAFHCMGRIDPGGIPLGNFLLVCMGSAVPPDDGSDGRTQLDTKVRNPWNSGVDVAHVKVGCGERAGHKQGLRNRARGEPTFCGDRQDTTPANREGRNRVWARSGWATCFDTSEKEQHGGRRCGVPVGNVQPKWEQVKRSRAEDEESTLDEQRVKCIKPNGRSFKARKTRMKGSTSMAEVSVMARNRSWRATARNVLKGKFYSASTSASKASKRRTIMDVAYACTEDEPVFPVTVEILVDIASVINYTEMKAGDQYLYELKLMQLENGYEWTDQLERHLQMCKRALVRDKGPDDRAVEFKPEAIEWTCLDRIIVEKGCPQSVHLSYVWASVWMLRAVEATALEVGHVVIDRHQKLVRLFIPRSKTDQKAKGVTRCLSCCRQKTCDTTCPWALATMALAKLKDLNPSAPLFPANCGKRLSQYSLVRSWAGKLEGSITGHSARRSGAMMYARRNWHIQDISFLGRWKSSAVFRYVEQALEDVPVNNRAPPLQASQGVRQGGEKVVVVREKPCTETTLKVEATEAKLLEVNARLDALEKEKESQANLPVEDRSGLLWAVSKGRSGKLRHIVKQASWNLPLQEWSTSCGWKFAKRNVKVELTRKPNHQVKQCGKCQELEELRDKVTGGVGLAQLIEVWWDGKLKWCEKEIIQRRMICHKAIFKSSTRCFPPTVQKVAHGWVGGFWNAWNEVAVLILKPDKNPDGFADSELGAFWKSPHPSNQVAALCFPWVWSFFFKITHSQG